jgi:hypothetical protein
MVLQAVSFRYLGRRKPYNTVYGKTQSITSQDTGALLGCGVVHGIYFRGSDAETCRKPQDKRLKIKQM